jgi:hypothetical protein
MFIALLWVCHPSFRVIAPLTHVLPPTVLHPQLKLKYFQQHGWDKDWINTAEEMVRDEFKKYDVSKDVPSVVCLPLIPVIRELITQSRQHQLATLMISICWIFPWMTWRRPTNSMTTSRNLWRRFVTPLGGGGIIVRPIRSYQRWLSTFLVSLVSCLMLIFPNYDL